MWFYVIRHKEKAQFGGFFVTTLLIGPHQLFFSLLQHVVPLKRDTHLYTCSPLIRKRYRDLCLQAVLRVCISSITEKNTSEDEPFAIITHPRSETVEELSNPATNTLKCIQLPSTCHL